MRNYFGAVNEKVKNKTQLRKLTCDNVVKTQGQEVEFHEIKIHFFMRSKLNLFMKSNLFINI
jgi:hypothetical protein